MNSDGLLSVAQARARILTNIPGGGASVDEANARLGEDLGKFAFRPWSYDFAPKVRGKLSLTARATNKVGHTQTKELIKNPAGYHHNLIQTLTLDVA